MWKNADYKGMISFLSSCKWDDVFMYHFTADELWCAFREVIDHAIETYVPFKKVNSNRCVSKPLHKYPRHIQRLIARKRCLWRQHKHYPTDKLLAEKYTGINNECRAAVRNFEVQQENNVIQSKNSGSFFKYVNRKLGRKDGIGILKSTTGETVIADADKAALPNNVFASVNVADNNKMPHFAKRVSDEVKVEDVNFKPYVLMVYEIET